MLFDLLKRKINKYIYWIYIYNHIEVVYHCCFYFHLYIKVIKRNYYCYLLLYNYY